MLDSFFAANLSLCHNSNFPSKNSTFYDLQRKILKKHAISDGYERQVSTWLCSNCFDDESEEFLAVPSCMECHGTGIEGVIWSGGYYQRYQWCDLLFRIETKEPKGRFVYPSNPCSTIGNITDLSFYILVFRYEPVYLWQRFIYLAGIKKKRFLLWLEGQKRKDENEGIPL